jgi:hypothetical protein
MRRPTPDGDPKARRAGDFPQENLRRSTLCPAAVPRAAEVLPFPILKIDRLHELHRTRRAGLYACVPTSGGNLMVVV